MKIPLSARIFRDSLRETPHAGHPAHFARIRSLVLEFVLSAISFRTEWAPPSWAKRFACVCATPSCENIYINVYLHSNTYACVRVCVAGDGANILGGSKLLFVRPTATDPRPGL